MQDAVIVSATRTAVGRAPQGALKTVRPDEMAAAVITEALAYYEKVLGTAPGYRSVEKKVAALREAAAEGSVNAIKKDKVSYI